MNVLSLFDGMSCAQIALDELGVKVDNYYASEIDKWAIKTTQANYPSTIQLGDITMWKEWDIDWSSINLVCGGSPCQGFSFAGKQLAFDDPRSRLFFVFVDILNHIRQLNPDVKFLLENVRMKKESLDVITEYMGVSPVFINSSLLSAQSRQRYYWTNISDVQQPEDAGIYLKDIIESGDVDREKSLAITTRVAGSTLKDYLNKNRHQIVYTGGAIRGRYNTNGVIEQKLEINNTKKANSITTVRKDSLCIEVEKAGINGHDQLKWIYSTEGKSPTLTANSGGNQEPKIAVFEATKKGYAEAGPGEGLDITFPTSSTRRGRHMKDKINCLTASNFEYGIVTPEVTWRKLTPLECERLQTVPDNYTAAGGGIKHSEVSHAREWMDCLCDKAYI